VRYLVNAGLYDAAGGSLQFTVRVADIADLHERLERTRFPDQALS
jgi:hypothetical protein